jgi:hypothetical protein
MVRLRQDSGGAKDGLRSSVGRDDAWLDSDRSQEGLRIALRDSGYDQFGINVYLCKWVGSGGVKKLTRMCTVWSQGGARSLLPSVLSVSSRWAQSGLGVG